MRQAWSVIQAELPRSELLPWQVFEGDEQMQLRFYDASGDVEAYARRYRDAKQYHLALLDRYAALERERACFKARFGKWLLKKKIDWSYRKEQAHKDRALQAIRYRLGQLLRIRGAIERPNAVMLFEVDRYRPLGKSERDTLRAVYAPQDLHYAQVFEHEELDSAAPTPIEEID